jgi:hypothetical protein
MRPRTRSARDRFLDTARSHLGYRAAPNRGTIYGAATVHPNQTWDGSFIDFVSASASVHMPRMSSTVSGVGEFLRTRKLHRNPQPGDIAIFAWSTDGPFGQPHVGIVTDVLRWKSERSFLSIEGQIGPGTARGNPENTGVFERERFSTDVVGFARPDFARTRKTTTAEVDAASAPEKKWVRTGHFMVNKYHRSTVLLQLALGATVNLEGATRGRFDGQTRAAMAAYQRKLGRVGDQANGTPDFDSLRALADETGLFTVRL